MITLNSDRLRVEIPEPGEKPNTSLRFDHSGYISDVILDGTHHFCASEPLNLSHPTSGGCGLCNEWSCDVSGEAQIGEFFPKFGVGLIQKEDDNKYIFHKKYKTVQYFPVQFTYTDNSVQFVTDPVPCLGYAMRTTKEITVWNNSLTMAITAANTGIKNILMREFCHNFISIDGMATGSDYRLQLPAFSDLGHTRLYDRNGRTSSFRGDGQGITFCEFTAIETDTGLDETLISDNLPFTWKLIHEGIGMWVREEDSFKPGRCAVWAVDHIVSPEISVCFSLQPGESFSWTRRWTFGSSSDLDSPNR